MSLISFVYKSLFLLTLSFALTGCFKSSEERAAEHYENGLALVEAGDLPRALVEFRNTLQLDDSNLDAYRQLAEANLQLGRIPEAYGAFLRVAERVPEDVASRVVLSELAFQGQNWDEFERHGAKAVELDPDRPAIQAIGLGLDYRKAVLAKNQAEAEGIVVKAEALAGELPDNSIARQIRLDSYISEGRYSEAMRLLDEIIAETPQNLALYTIKLELLSRLGDDNGLEAELLNMLEVFPDEKTPKETYLRYLISRERTEDAERFLQDLVAKAAPEDRDGAFISLVQFTRQNKGDEDALAVLDEALAGESADSDVLKTLRASLIFDMGRQEEGIAALEEVLNDETTTLNSEDRQNTKTALAQMLMASGNEVGARKAVEEVLTESPTSPGALKMRASWMISDDNTDAAIADLRIVLDGNPDDADAMVLMAQAYERAGNKDLMLNFLSLAVEKSNNAPRYALRYAQALVTDEKYLQAESTLISTLRIAPGNPEILAALGNVYLRLDDMPRADQVANTLQEIEDPRARTAANGLQAEILARRVGPAQALEFLENLATQDDDLASKLTLIRARLQSGQIEEALEFANAAMADAPDNLQLRNALALTYAAARDYSAAEAEFEKILQVRPDAANVYLQLARLKGAQDDAEGARAAIERGLEQAPEAPDLLWAQASFLQNQGDIDGAINIYEALYERNSSNLVVANNLASLLATYREDENSLNRAEVIARRLNGAEIPAFQDTYGWILFRTGEVEEAVTYLEPAAAGLPNDPTVQFHLGQAYAALERKEDALAQMRKALEASGPLGDQSFRQRIQDRISELETSE